MDTFFEQIIKMKKTATTYLGYFLITLISILLIAIAWLFFRSIVVVIAALVVYGAFKLYSMLNVEYEYIITNSSFDIDKIIAKSSRKRVLSFDLSVVVKIDKYNKELLNDKNAIIACNCTEDNVYILTVQPEGKAKKSVVIAPDERMKEAMKKFLPKYVGDCLY